MLPQEARLEILRMAFEILSDRYNSERELIISEWEYKIGRANEQKLGTMPPRPKLPKPFTEEQVVECARKLSTFLSPTCK